VPSEPGPRPPADVELRRADWPADCPGIRHVRRTVFVEEQGIPEDEEWDAIDPVARHVLAVAANRDAVGTGRLEPTGKIGRVAVLPQYRGSGVGGAIMGCLVNQATELGFTRVYLHAQTAVRAFYERLGFRAEGPVFDEVGIPHVRMHLGIEQRDEHEVGRHGHEEHPLDAR
jgi:predicted GNAT family N-acyltransferase